LSAQRTALRDAWQHHQDTYGPINRFHPSWRTSKTATEYMVPLYPTATKIFLGDPFAAFVNALEKFDPATQTARPADLLARRSVARRHPAQGADAIHGALAIPVDTHGKVDLDEIARLRGLSSEQAREELGTLVYDGPATARLVPAAE